MKQSEERREYLRQSPVYKQCMQQIERGQLLLPACRNATVAVNRLNEATFSVNFDKVNAQTSRRCVSSTFIESVVSSKTETFVIHYFFKMMHI